MYCLHVILCRFILLAATGKTQVFCLSLELPMDCGQIKLNT
ncbi:hypothetical protein HanPSC8_Chr03g0122171 [Helianthus annuus]|nr:hypothetical protein HanPSC8_Chr03g0122171 [Helianthus annuus]